MTRESVQVSLQDTWYSSRNPTRRWLHCARRDFIISKIRRWARASSGAALDVGCGSGVYLPTLAELYAQVVALDANESLVRHAGPLAQKYPNVCLVAGDISRSGFTNGAFDLIVCSEVVEHVADPAKAIAEMHRLLKPHGILILSTPQSWSSLELTQRIGFMPGVINIVRLIYKEPVWDAGHISLMHERQVTRHLDEAGFHLCERFKAGLYMPLVAEFLGHRGLQLERWLEGRIRGGALDWLLWTQYYVAKK